MRFNGTVVVRGNSQTVWETYSKTLTYSEDDKSEGYFRLSFSHRAEGGYYRASFDLRGSREFLSEFLENALGREVSIYGNDGKLVWEGYVHSQEYDIGRAVYKSDLGDMANAVWTRYRVRGTTTTLRSAVQTDVDSITKYGRKEFVLSAGELESTDIADDISLQYLNLHEWPTVAPVVVDPDKELEEYPALSVDCRGWHDTLNWCTYNQTASTDNQAANLQIADVVGDTDVGQFINTTTIESNSVSVSKEYDADRRGGDIVGDIARIGDASGNRFLTYMDEDRRFVYEQASTPITSDRGTWDVPIDYFTDVNDPAGNINDKKGRIVPPWELKANNWIKVSGVLNPTMTAYESFVRDRESAYIEEVKFSQRGGLRLKTSRGELTEVLLARAAGGKTL